MPLSLQIVGPEWSEARILAIAGAYEDATPEIGALARRAPSQRLAIEAESYARCSGQVIAEAAEVANGRTLQLSRLIPVF